MDPLIKAFDAFLEKKGMLYQQRRGRITIIKKIHNLLPISATTTQAREVAGKLFDWTKLRTSDEAWELWKEFHRQGDGDNGSPSGRPLDDRKNGWRVFTDVEAELQALKQLRTLTSVTYVEACQLCASQCTYGKFLPSDEARFVQISFPDRVTRFTRRDAPELYQLVMRAVSEAADARVSMQEVHDSFVISTGVLRQSDPLVYRNPKDEVAMPPMNPSLVGEKEDPSSLLLQRYLKGEK